SFQEVFPFGKTREKEMLGGFFSGLIVSQSIGPAIPAKGLLGDKRRRQPILDMHIIHIPVRLQEQTNPDSFATGDRLSLLEGLPENAFRGSALYHQLSSNLHAGGLIGDLIQLVKILPV